METLKQPVSEQAQLALDESRAVFMSNIAAHFIGQLLSNPVLSKGMNRNVVKQTQEQLDKFQREVRRTAVPHEPLYLDKNLKVGKMLDLATLIDLVSRVGIEGGGDRHEEFLGLVIDALDAVFYAQQHRRHMHFGKYKALFKLFTDEIHADVNKEPGQLMFTNNKELFVRVAEPSHSPQIK